MLFLENFDHPENGKTVHDKLRETVLIIIIMLTIIYASYLSNTAKAAALSDALSRCRKQPFLVSPLQSVPK